MKRAQKVFGVMGLIMLLIYVFVACGAKSDYAKSEAPMAEVDSAESAAPEEPMDDDMGSRMVIRTASLTVRVESVEKSNETLLNMVKEQGGYVERASVNSTESPTGSYTLRVPEANFTVLIDKIKGLGNVEFNTIGGDDITREYTDNESKLRNYKKAEEQYLQIMKKADTIEDIIKIENELTRIREQIEVLTGRMKSMEDQVKMATIEVQLIQEQGISETSGPSFQKAWNGAVQGAVNSVNMILNVLASLIILIGFMIPLAPFIWLGWFLTKKYLKKKEKHVQTHKNKMIPMTGFEEEKEKKEKDKK